MKIPMILMISLTLAGCATITNDANVPVAISFSDGSGGRCELNNKRGSWNVPIPSTPSIRRSDDVLQYSCDTNSGAHPVGSIPSRMGGKIIASAVFLDFGIVDSITDKHREYPESYVIPVTHSQMNGVYYQGVDAESVRNR